MATANVITVWEAQPGPQEAFVGCPVFEVFFGGARGGGKTDAVLGEWSLHADEYRADAIGLMVRRSRIELLETFERARIIYTKLGATFTQNPMRVAMPNGARLTFAYLERDADAEQYQGHSYTRVYVEEAGNFPSPAPIMKLMATLRSGAGVPVGMRLTGNPGGPGHQWVRARYIDPHPLGWQIIHSPEGLERIYIPSRVADNVYLGADYVQRLRASGSPELVRAWLEGDWSVVSGAFFPEFSMDRHVIAPRSLPDHWPRFRSFDWGSARPFSCLWWAVSDGSIQDIARGCLVNYREWYGMRPGEPNVGLRMTAEAIADGIRTREADDPGVLVGVADPAMFAEDGGPSIAHRMMARSVIFRPADNKRIAGRGAMGGWDQVRGRLAGDADGRPMLLLFSTSVDLIRTLPALQHDDARPEDVDSDMEDHAPDSCFIASTRIATQRGRVRIDRVRMGDLVLTRDGYRPVTAVFTNGERSVMRVRLSDGSMLTGTPNHPVWVENEGFIPLGSLRYGDMMRPSWSLSSAPRSSNSWASAITGAVSTFSIMARDCTVSFGRTSTGQFRRARTSIIVTSIRRTISQTIWPALPKMNTSRSMADCEPATLLPTLPSMLVHQPLSGMAQMPAESGIGCTTSVVRRASIVVSQWYARLAVVGSMVCRTAVASVPMPASQPIDDGCGRTMWNGSVMAVATHSWPISSRSSCTALSPAQSVGNTSGPTWLRRAIIVASASWRRMRGQSGALTVVGEPTIAGKQRVFNLSVEQAEEYFANGVLVHNCRYACMSRPFIRDAKVVTPTDTWMKAWQRSERSDAAESWRVA